MLGAAVENPPLSAGKRLSEGGLPDSKRRRSSSGGSQNVFGQLLAEAGCELSSSRDEEEYEVEDPRKLRRTLEQRLTLNANLRQQFLAGLEQHLAQPGVLQAALWPMRVTSSTAPFSGDSFVRALLNIAPIQTDLAAQLLGSLPQLCEEGDGASAASGGSQPEVSLPQLILGQFRWLDHVSDPRALTDKLLEVLPGCPPALQRDAISFIPEIASEDDYEAVLNSLAAAVEADHAFILPMIEALSNMSLDAAQQARAVEMVLGRFQAAAAADLPQLARYLLQHAAGADAKRVAATLRDSLHFAVLSDPRLEDGQAGASVSGDANPEFVMLEALKQAMQLNPLAADNLLRQIRSLTTPREHCPLDFWLLLVLRTLSPERRKAAEGMLRRKFGEGHAEAEWVEHAIKGHERAMLEYFQPLLSLAQLLLRDSAEAVQAEGAALYATMFTQFPEAANQTEVLRALLSHLGTQVATEATAALAVLLQLSKQQTVSVLRHIRFLGTVLDYVEGYSDDQVQQVFALYGELIAAAGQQATDASRLGMGDEMLAFLRKQLNSSQARHRRVGIIGTVALVQRLGEAFSSGGENSADIGRRYNEAMSQLRQTFHNCHSNPEAFAFLCDQLAKSISRNAVGRKLMTDLADMLQTIMEENFLAELTRAQLGPAAARVQVGGSSMEGCLLWNLDGIDAPVAVNVVELVARELAPGSTSAPLLSVFGTLRLLAAQEMSLSGCMDACDALLGCPINLFDMSLADPQRFRELPAEQQRAVLLGLWYTLNWHRELLSAFSGQLDVLGQRGDDDAWAIKLFARVRGAVQLEAVLSSLLHLAPTPFTLPCLSNTLDTSPAAPAAAPPKKAARPAGASKKKGVKFAAAGEEGEEEAAAKPQGSDQTGSGKACSGSQGGAANTQAKTAPAASQPAAPVPTAPLAQLPAVKGKQRSLLLPALSVLTVGATPLHEQPAPCYAMLAPAAYLLGDLHSKLKALLLSTRRAAFLGRSTKSQLPSDLSELTADELLRALTPLLPAVRSHVDTACDVLSNKHSDADMADMDRRNFWEAFGATSASMQLSQQRSLDASSYMVALAGLPAAGAATSPSRAASSVLTLGLDCVKQLLAWPGMAAEAQRPLLFALLSAFSEQGQEGDSLAAGAVPDELQLLEAAKRCFLYFSHQLIDRETGAPPFDMFEHQHSLLLILDAISGVLRRAGSGQSAAGAKLLSRFSKRIVLAAGDMLKLPWAPESSKEQTAGWKGRGGALADVLRLYIAHSQEPVDLVAKLANEKLREVTDAVSGKQNLEMVAGLPSLSGSTLPIWYKTCWEQLQVVWNGVVLSAVSAEKERSLLDDPDALAGIMGGMQRCAAGFAALIQVVKCQEKRVAVHTQAVRSGGRFVECFFKVLPFWALVFADHQEGFQKLVKEVQRGTRVLQVLCSEGKSKREMPLAAKVPMVKRTLEKCLFKIKLFLTEVNQGGAFWLGNLKHKDLQGREVPSQYPVTSYDEDEGEEEEEEEELADDDTGYETAQTEIGDGGGD